MRIWSLLEGPVINLLMGSVLAYAAFSLLGEYRKRFMANPKAAMSAEVLMLAITSSGGPGYLAAFLLAGSVLCFLLAAFTLLFNLSSYFGVLH
ncbi:MAG: hypothetical protein HOP24_01240 [Sideroxydans sp.]|nr:hypothetical protein [Sideroxydans sp.]